MSRDVRSSSLHAYISLFPNFQHKQTSLVLLLSSLQDLYPHNTTMASFNHDHFRCNFANWLLQQNQDLEELISANSADTSEAELKILVEKGISHFEEYCERRALMVRHDAPCFMYPQWCSTMENAFLWTGGCRPSLFIRLLYCVCGSQLDAQLDDLLRGETKGNLADLSANQLDMINALHCKIIKEEDKISTRTATLQEEIADDPLAMIVKSAGRVGEWSQDLDRAMADHSHSLATILVDADKLRLSAFKELFAILTPLQSFDLLIATKKLHISMHEWGRQKNCRLDLQHPTA